MDHAFLLLLVMSVDSIRACHALRRSSEMAFISSYPECDGAICEGIVFVFLSVSLISSMDSGVRSGT